MEHGFTLRDAIFLILILAAIGGLFSAIITIRQNVEALKNPMGTCMAQFNLNTCTCWDKYDGMVNIKSINYTEPEYLNYGNFTLNRGVGESGE